MKEWLQNSMVLLINKRGQKLEHQYQLHLVYITSKVLTGLYIFCFMLVCLMCVALLSCQTSNQTWTDIFNM